jgi:hypothetical protein
MAGWLVRHASVAEKGSSERVRTLSISGGGPLGTGGAAGVVSVGEVVVAGGAVSVGSARNVSARPYGALKAMVSESPVASSV